MAFNVNNFVKDVEKPYTNRITDPIVSSTTYGLPASTSTIASATAEQMLNAGMASALAAELVAARTDNAVNGGADEFYVLSGKDPTRAARVSLQNFRRKEGDTKYFLDNTNPASKIAAHRSDRSVEIITVI